MSKSSKSWLLGLGLMSAGLFANAEVLYSITSDELSGRTLFDQSLIESSVVTIKPTLSTTATGDVQVLNQCLWSVKVEFDGSGSVSYVPGKMICVGPQQEVLESIPVGSVKAFGECTSGCESLNVSGDMDVVMTLEQPLEFNVQARNERQ